MAKKTISILASAVQINMEGTVPTVLSRDIALKFQKKHSHILRDIVRIRSMVPKEFYQSNFGLVTYTDAKGESRPAYALTRDAFSLLAMGFTGKAAIMWKLRYIEAFNALEKSALQQQKSITAQKAINLTPTQWERIRQVVHYRKRGFTYVETAKVMGIHLRSVNNLIRQAKDLGLLEDRYVQR